MSMCSLIRIKLIQFYIALLKYCHKFPGISQPVSSAVLVNSNMGHILIVINKIPIFVGYTEIRT